MKVCIDILKKMTKYCSVFSEDEFNTKCSDYFNSDLPYGDYITAKINSMSNNVQLIYGMLGETIYLSGDIIDITNSNGDIFEDVSKFRNCKKHN